MINQFVCIVLACGFSACRADAKLRPQLTRGKQFGVWRQAEVVPGRPSTVNCTWRTFEQRIDHFGKEPGTFPQRYCVYSKWWSNASAGGFAAKAGAPGPILFYTGNESPVEEYINNTGLMWELGEKMGALLVFAEHRYEPLSHPALCGKGTQRCFAYCTTAQAIADWAAIITELRKAHELRAPAVAFGGSYGGMLAGWFRMKYPDVVDGAIAASAPIWQLSSTVKRDTLDMPFVGISRGVSAAGGASDQCFQNLRAAWPLLEQVGRTKHGLSLLSKRINTCHPLQAYDELTSWAKQPYFLMAEGNYPFPSTYITYSVGPGLTPLPAWPMRVACKELTRDFGVRLTGDTRNVNYTLTLGDIKVSIDWRTADGNGAKLTKKQIMDSGVLGLAAAIADAAGVWYNVTKDKTCWDIQGNQADQDVSSINSIFPEPASLVLEADGDSSTDCPACPPCDDCPACPVSHCEKNDRKPCSYKQNLSKTFSWEGICANDDLSQIDAQGLGRDIYWPPSVPFRNYTVESIVGPHKLGPGYNQRYDAQGLRGAPTVSDPWSNWLTAYYGGRNVSHHRNIVWSNGALDPWSGMGVYPPGGGPAGPMVQNVSEDGSQIALVLDLGAHHLDLMFSDPRDPPCAKQARVIETQMIRKWCQEAYDKASEAFIV